MQENKLTGYPSIDKPWLKYYSEEAINAPLPECSVYDLLWARNSNNLQDYALDYFGRKMTFKTFFERIEEAAKAFLALGVKEGEIVSIVSVSTPVSVICFYALNRIGAVSNFLNVLAEQDDLHNFFVEAKSKVVVTLDLFAKKVLPAANESGAEHIIVFSVTQEMTLAVKIGYHLKAKRMDLPTDNHNLLQWADFLKMSVGRPQIHFAKDPHKPCLLAHTGGTTGEPKAVVLTDYAMNAVVGGYFAIKDSSEVLRGSKQNSVFLQVMIPFVVYGILTCTHMPLCMGWCLALIPKFDGSAWSKYFKKYGLHYAFAVPAYISSMLEDKKLNNIDFSKIRTIAMGGDGMNEKLENEINDFFRAHGSNVEVVKGYGLSEVSATAISTFPGCNKIGSVGIPLYANNVMSYDNDTEKERTYNEIGEICLQCPSRMQGYMNNEEATSQLFRIHADGSEWLHTGDLGYIDEDGFLFLSGRIKRMILTTKDGVAYKVFPNIPEEVLAEHTEVLQSCIVGAFSDGNEVLRAYVVVSAEKLSEVPRIETELRRICEQKLPVYSRPTFYEFREKLPLTAAGKIDYRALEKQAEEMSK